MRIECSCKQVCIFLIILAFACREKEDPTLPKTDPTSTGGFVPAGGLYGGPSDGRVTQKGGLTTNDKTQVVIEKTSETTTVPTETSTETSTEISTETTTSSDIPTSIPSDWESKSVEGGTEKTYSYTCSSISSAPEIVSNDPVCVTHKTNSTYIGSIYEEEPDVSSCKPGKLKPDAQNFLINYLNYMRSFHGLGKTSLDQAGELKAQAAGLIMAANERLSHYPDSTWLCYTGSGSQGAGTSNIGLGCMGFDNFVLSSLIDAFLIDPGDSNSSNVGHRRWEICPGLVTTAVGVVTTSKTHGYAHYVMGLNYKAASPDYIAWPPSGSYPDIQGSVLSARWSFSVEDADFSGVAVSITDTETGSATAVTNLLVGKSGYCYPTITYTVVGAVSDRKYLVKVTGVTVLGAPKSYSYETKVVSCLKK
ncbi:MAG: hypothetical protein HQK54_09775 [Oligoflexales bacterium]|nr:hypothetical protein [Oligoflexales bacterium]